MHSDIIQAQRYIRQAQSRINKATNQGVTGYKDIADALKVLDRMLGDRLSTEARRESNANP